MRLFRDQIKSLESLQELDLKIENLKKKKAAFPAHMKNLQDQFLKVQNLFTTRQNVQAELEKLVKQTEAALDLNRDRSNRASGKLEGVQNTNEFQAANKEIDQLKKLNTQLDEQNKKYKEDILSVTKDLDNLKLEVEKAQGERDSKQGEIAGQETGINTDITDLENQRKDYTVNVEKPILNQYDKVRAVKAGLGFVPAVGGRCSGCNMMIPHQLFNQVQKAEQAHQCPNCHRIMFVPVQVTTVV